MKYQELEEDFDNIRSTQSYVVGSVIDEAQRYISHLEGKEDLLENLVKYLNTLVDSNKSRVEILADLELIFKD